MCVVPIVVSEPSKHITFYVLGLAADFPEGFPSNLRNFSESITALSHKVFMGLARYYSSTPHPYSISS
jgi:hypothetical protein